MSNNYNGRHIASTELSEQGFPFCPVCGGVLFYDDQHMLNEFKPDESDEKVVTYLHCADCERDYEVVNTDDGGYEFIDISRY